MPDLWTAPAGTPADLRVLPMLPIPPGTHIEQLIWHGTPGSVPGRVSSGGPDSGAGEPGSASSSEPGGGSSDSSRPDGEPGSGSGSGGGSSGGGGGAVLRLVEAQRSASGRVVTLRLLHGEHLLADLRVRQGEPRAEAAHPLLRTALGPGASCTRTFTVTADLTTDHVPDAEPVLSTPALIAAMEDTAADVLRPHFAAATASLGTWIGVRHTGPAHTGQEFVVSAVIADVRGRRYLFDVHATLAGRLIGDGQVAQTLIGR